MSYSESYLDVSEHIPQIALDTRDAKPDIRQTYDTISAVDEGYDNRTGDLSNLIEQAADNNQIVDLGSGTYEMESTVNVTSGTFGVVGDGSDSATIYYQGIDVGYLFFIRGASTQVLEGFTVDITEPGPNGLDTDVGLASSEVTNEIWNSDILFRGQRHLNQDYDGDGEVEPPSASRRMTFLQELTTYDGVGYHHNLRFPDGGTDEAETIGTVGHAIGPNADPSHIGTNVWYQCHCAGFMDNGYYVNNSDGPNILWDCTADNCGAGNFRLGNQDIVVGCSSEVTDLPNDRRGKALDVNFGDNIEVYGFNAYGTGTNYGSELIQIRDGGEEDDYLENLHMEKVCAYADGERQAIRYSGEIADITIQDCYFHKGGSTGGSAQTMLYNSSTVTADNVFVHSDTGGALYIAPNTGATFTYEGQTYGEGSYTVSDIGFGDPRPLPQWTLGEGTGATEYEVVLKVIDDSTAEPIQGAAVSVGDEPTITTGSDGIADFGVLPTGDYSYNANANGYNGKSGTYSNNSNATFTVALNSVSSDDNTVGVQVNNRENVGIGDVTVTLYDTA